VFDSSKITMKRWGEFEKERRLRSNAGWSNTYGSEKHSGKENMAGAWPTQQHGYDEYSDIWERVWLASIIKNALERQRVVKIGTGMMALTVIIEWNGMGKVFGLWELIHNNFQFIVYSMTKFSSAQRTPLGSSILDVLSPSNPNKWGSSQLPHEPLTIIYSNCRINTGSQINHAAPTITKSKFPGCRSNNTAWTGGYEKAISLPLRSSTTMAIRRN